MSDRTWRLVKWSGIGLVAALILAVPYLPGRTEPVTREGLDEARALWSAAGLDNYDLDLETRGAQAGQYHIEVRDAKLSSITRDGIAANPAAGEPWTVRGLFQVIEEELDASERPDGAAFGAESEVFLRVQYDRTLGFPTRFVREVKQPSRRSATGYEVPGATSSVEILVRRLIAK